MDGAAGNGVWDRRDPWGTWTQGCGDMRDVGVQGPVEAMGTCGRCRDTEGWRLGIWRDMEAGNVRGWRLGTGMRRDGGRSEGGWRWGTGI